MTHGYVFREKACQATATTHRRLWETIKPDIRSESEHFKSLVRSEEEYDYGAFGLPLF